jgi:hypothetical protein
MMAANTAGRIQAADTSSRPGSVARESHRATVSSASHHAKSYKTPRRRFASKHSPSRYALLLSAQPASV